MINMLKEKVLDTVAEEASMLRLVLSCICKDRLAKFYVNTGIGITPNMLVGDVVDAINRSCSVYIDDSPEPSEFILLSVHVIKDGVSEEVANRHCISRGVLYHEDAFSILMWMDHDTMHQFLEVGKILARYGIISFTSFIEELTGGQSRKYKTLDLINFVNTDHKKRNTHQ